jgi:hypothetical protein
VEEEEEMKEEKEEQEEKEEKEERSRCGNYFHLQVHCSVCKCA